MELCATEESGKAELSSGVKEETRPRDGERDRDADGCVVSLSPLRLCWFVDNSTMNGENSKKAVNFGKNGNHYSRSTVMATAAAFREGVQPGTSTVMLLCPSDRATGNPKLWLEAYSKARSDDQGQEQARQRTARGLQGKGAASRSNSDWLTWVRKRAGWGRVRQTVQGGANAGSAGVISNFNSGRLQ